MPDFAFDRIGGEDRYETAALVADEYGNKPDAIVANGQPGFYADALASNYLSGAEDAPILLTRIKELPQHTLDQLDQMNAQNVTIVGGESVVPAAQEQQLKDAGYTVTRIAGDDRFETNADVLAADGASTGGVGLIATGFNFPDALAAGPFAYNGHSLGLSTKDDVKDVVLDALVADGVKEVLIFGGTDAVGPGVEADLASRGITVKQRFAGADRSETSELAAEWALKNLNFTNKHVGVASGYTLGYGADALAGGPLEGKADAPMLITRNVDNPDDVLDYLKAHCSTLETGHLFGGPAAISVAAEAQMEAAASCAAASAVALPELTAAQVISTVTTGQETSTNPRGTVVRFTFDEDFSSANVANFYVTEADGTRYAGARTIVAQTARSVDIRFTDVASTTDAGQLTVATVDNGAVSQTDGDTNPEGDAPLGTTSGGGTVSLPAGITKAPDLLSVGGFRDVAPTSEPGTVVDFTFDEAANTAATPPAGAFQVHLLDGTVYTATGIPQVGAEPLGGPSGENNPGGDGTTVITVEFDENFTAAQVARGTVAEGAVTEQTDNESPADGTGNANEMQAAPVSASGNTSEPDLVSVELRPDTDTDGAGPDTDADQALFTFDQAVAEVAATTPVANRFGLYDIDGNRVTGVSADVNNSNPTQVLVTFGPTATNNAVGGNVDAGAVTSTTVPATQNDRDEEGVANTSTSGSQTAGKTAGPDLTGVKVAVEKDVFGNTTGTDATYTFDEDVTAPVSTRFFLFLANGTKVAGTDCVKGSTEETDNTVICEFSGVTGDLDREFDAAIGTVDYQAVAAEDGGPANPEGAEKVTR